MNSIDMRFSATVGMGSVGVENVLPEGVETESTATIQLENLRAYRAGGKLICDQTPECGFAGGPSLLT